MATDRSHVTPMITKVTKMLIRFFSGNTIARNLSTETTVNVNTLSVTDNTENKTYQYLSRLVGKQTMLFPTRSGTNRPVQL